MTGDPEAASCAHPGVARGRRAARRDAAAPPARRRNEPSLAWRVFLSNAAVLVCAFLFLVLTPATISSPPAVRELLVLTLALAASLFVNLVLLRRAFGPLERLTTLLEEVDPLRPGQRLVIGDADSDVRGLARAYNDMLERLQDERRLSARRVLLVQEEERSRIARELHDELGQTLTGLLLLLDQAARAPQQDVALLEDARETARQTLDGVRLIARDLRPESLEDLGLVSALRALSTAIARQTGVDVRRELPPDVPPLGAERELVVYRVAQEALTNAVRHAQASEIVVSLESRGDAVRLRVADDGVGFAGPEPRDGGIRGMRERALLVRGRLDVRSAPARGTEVMLEVAAPPQEAP